MTMNQAIDEDIIIINGGLIHLMSILRQGTKQEHKLSKKHTNDLLRVVGAVEAILLQKATK